MKLSVWRNFCAFLFVGICVAAGANAEKDKYQQISYVFSNWERMCYVDEDGVAKGLYLDLLREVLEKELKMILVSHQLPWKRSQINVRDGKADFLITVATDERLSYAVRSDLPFYEMYLNVFTYAQHPKLDLIRAIKTAGDIKTLDLTAVTNLGNGWHKVNIDSAGVNTRYLRKEENALLFLANKRADIMIDGLVPTHDSIGKLGLVGKVVSTEARFGPIKMYFLMSKKSKYVSLMPEINAAFLKLKKQGTIDAIIEKYRRVE